MKRLICLCCAALLLGCAHRPAARENLPSYPWTSDAAALRELSLRTHSVQTISAAALLTLTRPDGQSVRLDGAMAVSLADKSVRLRAWKMGQAVFDLTETPRGLWIETPKDAGHSGQIAPARSSASNFARAISVFGGDIFNGPGVRVIDRGGPHFQVSMTDNDGQDIIAVIERSTLAIVQYRVTAGGVTRFTLDLSDYHVFNGITWPSRLIARSETGAIDAQLLDIELNASLPQGAFIPPRGAEKAP
jgi:hypothetical protein